MDRYLKQLPTGWVPFSDDRGSGYQVDYPHGSVKLIRPGTIPGCEADRSWVCVSLNPDGTASHGQVYPSFKQALAAINRA